MTPPNRIDVHHHILPAHYVETVGADSVGLQGSAGRVPAWSIDAALAGMDAAGIRTALTSISSPGFAPADAAQVPALARWCNEFAADMVRDYPGRFGMFAALPLNEVDAALTEVTHAYDVLHADGLCLLSNYAGRYLGDANFRPLYAELNRRSAVVFVHPVAPAQPWSFKRLSASTLEFPFDTTRTIASLIFEGIVRDYPSIRWIFSHAGGAITALCGRIELLSTNNPALREFIPHGFAAELKKLYFDTALSADPGTMAHLEALVSTDRILFGTDYPFGPRGQMQGASASLDALPWSEPVKGQVAHGNAQKLFPRFS